LSASGFSGASIVKRGYLSEESMKTQFCFDMVA
jgi:hypothetical protein